MYYKQLDGLRAFAVIAVIIHHWFPKDHHYAYIAHWGAYGVNLFFVLSGFLISSILLKQKAKNGFEIIKGLKIFYARRSLRIFPIYYLVILITAVFCFHEVQDKIIWLILYQYNNQIFLFDWEAPVYIQHLWTLSIEEQFYLIWPFVLFLFSNKNSFKFITLLLILSIITKAVLYKLYPDSAFQQFTLSSFFGLSLGSLLAFLRAKNIKIKYRKILFFFTLSLTVYFLSPFLHFSGKSFLSVCISFPTILFVFLIDKTIDGFKGITKHILENKLLVYIGKISYGIYLYHMFIPYLTGKLTTNIYLNSFTNLIILIIISSLSWYVIERPINNLKSKFNY